MLRTKMILPILGVLACLLTGCTTNPTVTTAPHPISTPTPTANTSSVPTLPTATPTGPAITATPSNQPSLTTLGHIVYKSGETSPTLTFTNPGPGYQYTYTCTTTTVPSDVKPQPITTGYLQQANGKNIPGTLTCDNKTHTITSNPGQIPIGAHITLSFTGDRMFVETIDLTATTPPR